MDGGPRILVLTQGYPISSLVDDIRTSVSDLVVIDARSSDQLKSETDFRLVLHFARDVGKRITVITRDPVVTALATQLGVDVLSELPEQKAVQPYDGVDEPAVRPDQEGDVGEAAPDERFEGVRAAGDERDGVEGGREGSAGELRGVRSARKAAAVNKRRLPPRAVIVFAALALVTVGALLVYVLGQRVEVTVVPATVSITETVIIAADPTGRQPSAADVSIGITVPSEVLSVDVEHSTEMPTTGERREGITPAVGEVLLINSSVNPITVPARTKLSTPDGIEFETVNDVVVDAKTITTRAGIKVGETNGTAVVAASACDPGSGGNVPAMSITAIKGPLAGKLQVVNENEFKGGRDRVTRVVAEADVEHLIQISKGFMLEDGAARLRKLAGIDRYLLLPTLELHVKSSRVYPNVSMESDRVSIDAEGRVDLASVHFRDLSAAIEDKLSVAMGDGFRLLADQLQIDSLSCAGLSSGIVAISVDVNATFVADVDERLVAAALAGEQVEEASRRLLESGEVAEFAVGRHIDRFPRWLQLIDVTVAEPTEIEVNQETDTGGV